MMNVTNVERIDREGYIFITFNGANGGVEEETINIKGRKVESRMSVSIRIERIDYEKIGKIRMDM